MPPYLEALSGHPDSCLSVRVQGFLKWEEIGVNGPELSDSESVGLEPKRLKTHMEPWCLNLFIPTYTVMFDHVSSELFWTFRCRKWHTYYYIYIKLIHTLSSHPKPGCEKFSFSSFQRTPFWGYTRTQRPHGSLEITNKPPSPLCCGHPDLWWSGSPTATHPPIREEGGMSWSFTCHYGAPPQAWGCGPVFSLPGRLTDVNSPALASTRSQPSPLSQTDFF